MHVHCARRLYLNYHSDLQVAVGLALGAGFAAFWFFVVDPILQRSGLFSTPLARSLYIRDYGPIPNAIAFEYEAVQRATAERRGRKA